MSKECVGHIGQKVEVGDWCAITQHNTIYVGKVIKASSSVTIAVDSIDEFIQTDKKFKSLKYWKDRSDLVNSKFGVRRWSAKCSWARDGKFIKISPTDEMVIAYDKQVKKEN